MTASTVKVMEQRLTRGTSVIVADSFGKPKLRGKTQVVTSKGPVKCNKGGRCAGDWCVGLAIFVAPAKSANKDKKMGWRGGTTKVCLTHLKDKDGVLLVPPPLVQQGSGEHSAIPTNPKVDDVPLTAPSARTSNEVTWGDLAEAHRAGNINKLAVLARALKAQNETLKSKVIESQERLIENLME